MLTLQVGFNAGDGRRYYNVPGSRTPAIVDIELKTNVGTRGRWVFRVDGAEIRGSGCDNEGNMMNQETQLYLTCSISINRDLVEWAMNI